MLFLDQEFEYQSTIDLVRKWMHQPDVDPYWFQIPIRMFNTNSPTQPWVKIWDPEREDTWMRPLEPDSIKGLKGQVRTSLEGTRQHLQSEFGCESGDAFAPYLNQRGRLHDASSDILRFIQG